MHEDVLAVIIGRAGSKGLPGKNRRPIAGLPMVVHSIEHARRATSVDRLVVSTDCPLVAAAARTAGASVVDRPRHLATDDATVHGAVRHAVESIGSTATVVVVLYANVPVRPEGLVDRAVASLRETGADSVQSYQPVGKHHPYWMVRLDGAGRVEPHEPNAVHRRQDLPPLLLPDGGVIAVRRSLVCAVERPGAPHEFLGADRRGIVNEPGSVIDVDTEVDAIVAEAVLARSACGAVS
ncbi:MAG: acylneuraminate cytidylyltransferase family protein [Planctomycetota bacterium]|jgi:N-acylneuraminate cytidylyltransferase